MNSRLPRADYDDGSAGDQPVIAAILKYLIRRHGGALGLPSWDDQYFVADFSKKAKVSLGTARNLREGLSNHPQAKIRERLAELFREAVPHLEAQWFLSQSVEQFIARAEDQPKDRKIVTLSIPAEGYKHFDRLRRWLCGVYICYRYSFEQNEERLVAREVLNVKHRNGSLLFEMSFVPGGGEINQDVRTFTGVILPIGESAFFVGWNDYRGRSLFLHCDFAPEAKDCRFGILSSTRLGANRAPLAACTVILKRPSEPKNLERFMSEMTVSRPFNEMIDADFGENARDLMSAFLDNGHHVIEIGGKTVPDTVLRLNLHRFNAAMPSLYRAALNNPGLRSPFKAV
jgi:hypothetical protein